MADTGDKQSTDIWPIAKFNFKVEIADSEIACQEVSGLDMETEAIEYRAGNSKTASKVRMPGLLKYSNITLKKGVFKGDKALFEWFKSLKSNTIERKSMVIKLCDETGEPMVTWKVTNAFPLKFSGTDLKAEGNEIAIETIEVAHEGIDVEYA